MNNILTEGKHWPADYIKTAFNAIKNSDLGKLSWYSDNYILQDCETFADEFKDLSHKSSNLGYFMPVIHMFISYTGTSRLKYQEFIETKLDNVIRWLKLLVNDSQLEAKNKEKIKGGMSYEDFEKLMKPVEDLDITKANSTKFTIEDKGYDIVRIDSYQQLHKLFGGRKTGYNGESEWCHTNGRSTYNSWTNKGTYNFFVVFKKDFKDIRPPEPADNAYDEYGLSLIAILVQTIDGKLKNCTLRWNHVIEPSSKIPGRTVDRAFIDYNELSKVAGFDVKAKVLKMIDAKSKDLQKKAVLANNEVAKILNRVSEINGNTIPKKLKDKITSISIPKSVTSIGNWAFYGCTSLTSISIPESVTSIGDMAFSNCASLTSISIPESVTSIGDLAFYRCTSLTSISIPESVTSIGDIAFKDCTSLTSISIPESVTSIGDWTFYGCTSLTSISIPESVTSIGDMAFKDCTSLTSISIPESVTSIGDLAFYGCTSLTSISIPESVTSIGNWAFYGCTSLTSISIPESVTSIGDKAFYGCTSLTSISIPESVTSIGDKAFSNCASLTSISIPESVTSIGDMAFSNCASLTSISIPNSVTSIGNLAFSSCKSLKSIIFENPNYKDMENYPWGIENTSIFKVKLTNESYSYSNYIADRFGWCM